MIVLAGDAGGDQEIEQFWFVPLLQLRPFVNYPRTYPDTSTFLLLSVLP